MRFDRDVERVEHSAQIAGRRLERELDLSGLDRSVQRGDRVIFSSYSGTEVKIEDEEMLILSEIGVSASSRFSPDSGLISIGLNLG